MPINPVGIYIASGMVIAGTGYAFKKFVYDPHLGPWLEALAVEFLNSRGQHQVLVPLADGPGDENARRRHNGLSSSRSSKNRPSGSSRELEDWSKQTSRRRASTETVTTPLMIDEGPSGLSSSFQLAGEGGGSGQSSRRRVVGSSKELDERVKAIGMGDSRTSKAPKDAAAAPRSQAGSSAGSAAGSDRVANRRGEVPEPHRPSQHFFPARPGSVRMAAPTPPRVDMAASTTSLDNASLGYGEQSEMAHSRSIDYSMMSEPRLVDPTTSASMEESMFSSIHTGPSHSSTSTNPWTHADRSTSLRTGAISPRRAASTNDTCSPFTVTSSLPGTPTSYAGMSPQVEPAHLPMPMQPLVLGQVQDGAQRGMTVHSGTTSEWEAGSVTDSWVDADERSV